MIDSVDMPRRKRTAEELRIAILEKIKELEEEGVKDINKTAIANAIGINNTLVTSLLDGMKKNETVFADSTGNHRITKDGQGWLAVEKVGRGKAGRVLLELKKIEREKSEEAANENIKSVMMAVKMWV